MPPHVVVIPFPVQGHINPLIRLSEKLASQGITITFVNTEFNHFKIMKAHNSHGILESPCFNIRFAQVSDGLSLDFNRMAAPAEAFNGIMIAMRASTEDLLNKLLTQRCEPPVSCVIGTSFLTWTLEVAKKFELPFVAFWSQAVSVEVIYRHLSLIKDNGDFPPKGMIDYIPGIPPMHPEDFPSDIQSGNPSNRMHHIILQQIRVLEEAAWVVSNTVYELESQANDVIAEQSPLFRSIGPLLPSIYFEGESKQHDFSIESSRSLSLQSESNCLPWLDSNPKSSVLYVSFGSFAQISRVQAREIARGLMESEQAFLWVIRPDLVRSEAEATSLIDYNEILPEGFLDKTKDRGLLVPWSPQLLVLSHPSVGGFFTHGGWNSTMESLSLGVPMLVFPLGIEQSTNRMLVVNHWKVGLRFDSCRDDSVVEGAEIARCVRDLLKDEEMRKRSNEVRETIMRSVDGGGSSWKNMRDFVDYLLSLSTIQMDSALENRFKE